MPAAPLSYIFEWTNKTSTQYFIGQITEIGHFTLDMRTMCGLIPYFHFIALRSKHHIFINTGVFQQSLCEQQAPCSICFYNICTVQRRLKSRTLGLKSFSLFIFSERRFHSSMGYKLRHCSKPLETTNSMLASFGNCFLKPAGKRNRPFASMESSYSPIKLAICLIVLENETQRNTFYHFPPLFTTAKLSTINIPI